MCFVRRARAVTNPQHMCRASVPFLVRFIKARQRRFITQQQRLMRGKETGFGKFFHFVERQAAGLNETDTFVDAVDQFAKAFAL